MMKYLHSLSSQISSKEIRACLSTAYTLHASSETTGGPARYYYAEGSNTRFGFISPHSENVCGNCNRVRVTAEGRLLLCLGNEHSVDLKAVIRESFGDMKTLKEAIYQAMYLKPERHHFENDDAVQIVRFMNETGG